MAKIAILGDPHWGVRGDSPYFLEYFERFYSQKFIPDIVSRGIKDIIVMGDFFDRRKYINFLTLNSFRKNFVQPLKDKNINVWGILGNHDVFFKNTSAVNACEILLQEYDNFKVSSSPEIVEVCGLSVAMVPWINRDNEAESLDFIETRGPIVDLMIGHFEIKGFKMSSGYVCESGLDPKLFEGCPMVLTGHFHDKSSGGNIIYVGAPYQMNFGDIGVEKGYHVLDSQTMTLEFVKNPDTLFERIIYDDYREDPRQINVSHVKGKNVRVVVQKKTKSNLLDELIDRIRQAGPENIQIRDAKASGPVESDEKDTIENMDRDVIDMILQEIDDLPESQGHNKSEMKKVVSEIYAAALDVE